MAQVFTILEHGSPAPTLSRSHACVAGLWCTVVEMHQLWRLDACMSSPETRGHTSSRHTQRLLKTVMQIICIPPLAQSGEGRRVFYAQPSCAYCSRSLAAVPSCNHCQSDRPGLTCSALAKPWSQSMTLGWTLSTDLLTQLMSTHHGQE